MISSIEKIDLVLKDKLMKLEVELTQRLDLLNFTYMWTIPTNMYIIPREILLPKTW